MAMKKISWALLLAAAYMSVALAHEDVLAPAPSPASGSHATVPVIGSFVGASLLSFFALYLN